MQYLIGAIQWALSLGRLDVNTTVMTLVLFRTEPREGYLDRARRVVSFVVNFNHATIRIKTKELGLSSIPINTY